MTEKQLIGKLRELRQIKPRKDWVVLTKSQILGEADRGWAPISFFPVWRPALATITAFGILFGFFGFAQSSLPGDFLYPIKKIVEKSRAVFVSEKELPKLNLELANRRMEELNKVTETNQIRNLAPAISEVKESISKVVKNPPKPKDPEEIDEIGKTLTSLIESVKKAENSGIVLNVEEEYCFWAENEIKDLEERTLTEEQMKILTEAKADSEAGNCSDALIKILILSQPQ